MSDFSPKPTVVELFAGAGGMMLGLEEAGFRTLLANEVHAHPCMTMRANFPKVPVVEGSIRDLTAAQMFERAGYDKVPPVDLVAGGPPCQGFSTAGMKDPNDPRNTLIGDYIRIVKETRPRAFLLENVTGLLTMRNGVLWENVATELDELGYKFQFAVLHAADFGVPQMRNRLIVLGAREDTPPSHPTPTHRSAKARDATLFDEFLKPMTTCGNALEDLPTLNPGEAITEYDREPQTDYQRRMRRGAGVLHNHQASKHRQETMDYYGLIPPGGTALDIPKELRNGKQGVQRWPVDGVSRTITTEPTDFLHPTLNRIPTIRELARIQSFPDRFVFLGQRTTGNKMRRLGYCSQSQQVGNAVPPMLAEAVGRAILDHWR
ncbi:MAG: DNA cytosine methyltransferase [Planctomycetota bacterium]